MLPKTSLFKDEAEIIYLDRRVLRRENGVQTFYLQDAEGRFTRDTLVLDYGNYMVQKKEINPHRPSIGTQKNYDMNANETACDYVSYDKKSGRESIFDADFILLQESHYDQDNMLLTSNTFKDGQLQASVNYREWKKTSQSLYDEHQRVTRYATSKISAEFMNSGPGIAPAAYGYLKYNLPFNRNPAVIVTHELDGLIYRNYYDRDERLQDAEVFINDQDGKNSGYVAFIGHEGRHHGFCRMVQYDENTRELVKREMDSNFGDRNLLLSPKLATIYQNNAAIGNTLT